MAWLEIAGGGTPQRVEVPAGTQLSEALNLGVHRLDLPCAGAGTCLACRVGAEGALSPPDAAEREALGPALKAGQRLACQATLLGDARVTLAGPEAIGQILTAGGPAGSAAAPWYRKAGLAVDIGTTTLAVTLFTTEDNPAAPRPALALKNPQTRFGADVLSRIQLALEGQGAALAEAVRGGVAGLAAALTEQAGLALNEIDALVLTGNTAMLYLLTGASPDALSHAPFEADRLFGEALPASALIGGLAPEAKIYLPRCMSAFVGADITTAALATGLCDGTGPALLVDIGTNGEIALFHGGRLTCCSTAAGPAFEGAGIEHGCYAVAGAIDKVWAEGDKLCFSTIGDAPPRGLCGSGIIDTMALLLRAGVVDETGAFQTEGHPFEDRVTTVNGQPALKIAGEVAFTAADVRQVQLAKGAVRAGMETLLAEAGLTSNDVERFYIAGGFGNYLNLQNAAEIGLLPGTLAGKAHAAGNAALAGAGRLLQDTGAFAATEALAKSAKTVDLGANPVFQQQYMEQMMFE